MRSVQITIATTMLAVPASAVALNTATAGSGQSTIKPQSPLALRVSPQRVAFGDPVGVTGTAPAGAAGRTVVLETALRRNATWRRLAATRIGRRGSFRFRVDLRRSGWLRVVQSPGATSVPSPSAAAAGAAGAGSAGAGGPTVPASKPHPVAVAAQLSVPNRQLSVLGGNSVRLSGRLLPAQAGRVIALEGNSPGGWRTLARTRTGRLGGFTLREFPSSGVGRRLRVVFAGDRANARSAAAAGTVTVYDPSVASWYDDGGSTACGFHAALGVANRSLPCGTKVRFRYGARTVIATVDDRGPFVGGRTWDLNQNTAAALGFSGVDTVWSAGG